MQLLAEGLEGLAPAGDPVCEALAKLAGLVAQWAPRMNLTAHRTAESVARRLILDAVALDAALPAGVDSLVDVGSGAGFPGLPLAILHPERRIVLIEARERRHHFQRMAIRALGLTNVEARHGRAESLSPSLHDVGIAQAAATPAEAVLLLLPWVRPGGCSSSRVERTPRKWADGRKSRAQRHGTTRYRLGARCDPSGSGESANK